MISEKQWETIFKLRDTFALNYFQRNLYDYQKDASNKIIKAVLLSTGETIAIEHSRQAGKTEAIVVAVKFLQHFYYSLATKFNLAIPEYFNIGIFAPQQDQSRTDFERIRDYGYLLKEDFAFQELGNNSSEYRIVTPRYPVRTTYCFTLSPTSHPESKTLHLIIFEEAQDLTDFRIDKTAMPMGTNTNAVVVYIGTAGYRKNRFKELIDSLPPEQKVVVPYKKAIKERKEMYKRTNDERHLYYERFVQSRIRDIGEDSDEFRTQYKLEWVLERGQFITYEDLFVMEKDYYVKTRWVSINTLEKTEDKDEKEIIVPESPYTEPCMIGIDWGKQNDNTVMTVVNESGKIIYWLSFSGDDYSSQLYVISNVILKYFPKTKYVQPDATATQDMINDQLREKLKTRTNEIPVNGVIFTSITKDEMYKNLSRLMLGTRIDGKIVEEPWLSFPKEWPNADKERFLKQFLDLQKEIRNNRWSCHHPEGSGYFDDFTDSLALAVYDKVDEVTGFGDYITIPR